MGRPSRGDLCLLEIAEKAVKLFIGVMIGLGCGLSFGSWHEKRSIVDLTEYTSLKIKELGDYCVESLGKVRP